LQKRGGEQDRLTVHEVSELNLPEARMAYLSACSTAENKATRLSDEVIHLVSGFQVAGFPHVVGCLWPSKDTVCVEVADRFYSLLFCQGRTGWGDGEVASALQQAVMAVKADMQQMPLLWAPFVHYGA
jgi:CHAT domain-containing protein